MSTHIRTKKSITNLLCKVPGKELCCPLLPIPTLVAPTGVSLATLFSVNGDRLSVWCVGVRDQLEEGGREADQLDVLEPAEVVIEHVDHKYPDKIFNQISLNNRLIGLKEIRKLIDDLKRLKQN